jgi:peptide/nickel transport system permease protein
MDVKAGSVLPRSIQTLHERHRESIQFVRRYSRNSAAVLGLLIVVIVGSVAIAATHIATHDPFAISATRLSSPSSQHFMGTDDIGRDIFSGIVYGTRVILLVGVTVAVVASGVGILVGALSGYYGGAVDSILMRITELFQVLPTFFLALVIVAITGPGLWKLIFVISMLSWPRTARLVRVQYYAFKEKEFTEAARAIGQNDLLIMFRHILPNALPPAIVMGSLVVAEAILLQAGLSFFGLGDPNVVDWGQMLNNAQRYLSRAWWLSVFPGSAIFLIVMAFNLIGDGLNDALNPRMRER